MATQQQGIVDALCTLLATVTGIVTVTKNRPKEEPFSLAQLPAINISVTDAEVIQEHSVGTDEKLTVVLSVFCHGNTSMNSALDYMNSALGKIGSDGTLGGKAIDSRKIKRACESFRQEVLCSEVHQEVHIDIRTPRWGI